MRSIYELRRALAKTPLRRFVVWRRHLGLRSSDCFLASYPRSGSNWVKFLLLESILDRELDFPQSDYFMPYVGTHRSAPQLLPGGGRLIKTHEIYHPVYGKSIYLVRDPRDVVISEYRLLSNLKLYNASFERFLVEFLDGGVSGLGCWSQHVESWLTAPPERVLVVRFGDLHRNPQLCIQRMLDFLAVSVSAKAVQKAIDSNNLESMKKKEDQARHSDKKKGFIFSRLPDHARFVNQGRAQGWVCEIGPSQQTQMESRLRVLLERLGYLAVPELRLDK